MKKSVLILLTCFLFSQAAWCDTIDFYHVFYNDVQIGAYNEHHLHQQDTLHLKQSLVNAADKLSVFYGSDTPCWDCYCYLAITPHNSTTQIIFAREKGEGTLLNLNMKAVLDYHIKTKETLFDLWYFEDKVENKKLLFHFSIQA